MKLDKFDVIWTTGASLMLGLFTYNLCSLWFTVPQSLVISAITAILYFAGYADTIRISNMSKTIKDLNERIEKLEKP